MFLVCTVSKSRASYFHILRLWWLGGVPDWKSGMWSERDNARKEYELGNEKEHSSTWLPVCLCSFAQNPLTTGWSLHRRLFSVFISLLVFVVSSSFFLFLSSFFSSSEQVSFCRKLEWCELHNLLMLKCFFPLFTNI